MQASDQRRTQRCAHFGPVGGTLLPHGFSAGGDETGMVTAATRVVFDDDAAAVFCGKAAGGC